MKYLTLISLILVCVWGFPGCSRNDESPTESARPPASANVKGYDELIAKATSCAFRGIQPPENELRAAEVAYNLLAKEKDGVAEWIYSVLRANPERNPMPYGYVLWRFGADYVCGMEPSVLQVDEDRIRLNGVYILGMGQKYHKPVVELTTQILHRDSSAKVKAEAILSLDKLRAADDFDVVVPCLNSKDAVVRKAAVQFFWSYPQKEVVKTLKQLLHSEKDAAIREWIEKAITKHERYKDFPND